MLDDETIFEEQRTYERNQRGKSRRQKRIADSVKKNDEMYKRRYYVKMWQTHGYPTMRPKNGQSHNEAFEKAWDYDGKSIQHTGVYLQHPKNSNAQRFHKRESHKKVRRYFGDLNNGRHEHKLYEYTWNID